MSALFRPIAIPVWKSDDGTLWYATYPILARISSVIPGFGKLLLTIATLHFKFFAQAYPKNE